MVVVGAVILWRFFGDALSSRSDVAAARCVDGEIDISVVVDPAIVEPVQGLAQRYNDNAEPVGDRCVKVGVTSADSSAVVDGLSGQWPAELGERPALWIPASTASEARLESAAGPQAVSDSRSLVSSAVVLAVAPPLEEALVDQSWSSLPRLQTDPAALDGLGLQGWGGLRLALPSKGTATPRTWPPKRWRPRLRRRVRPPAPDWARSVPSSRERPSCPTTPLVPRWTP